MSGRNDVKENTETPGPGAYTHSTAIGKAPAYTLSGRTEQKASLETPGPGAYIHPVEMGKGSTAVTITGRYDVRNPTETPGPGSYSYHTEIGNGPSITLSSRPITKEATDSPGIYFFVFLKIL